MKLPGLIRVLRTWLDADFAESRLKDSGLDWFRMIPFVLLHLGCLAVFWVGVSPIALGIMAVTYIVRMFAITGFYHRYFSHKTFQTHRIYQFLFAILGASAAQRGPLWWASHHRSHHRYADTPQDPHSPHHKGFIWSHLGWFFSPNAFKTDYTKVADWVKFPELYWLNRYDTVVPLCLAGGLYGLGEVLHRYASDYHTSGPQLLVWGFFISTVLLFHATSCINSLAHVWGRRAYETPDHSRNSLLLALITLGEGWHNNHHFYPASARPGFRWWQIDATFYLLWSLSKLGFIRDLRPVRLDRGSIG